MTQQKRHREVLELSDDETNEKNEKNEKLYEEVKGDEDEEIDENFFSSSLHDSSISCDVDHESEKEKEEENAFLSTLALKDPVDVGYSTHNEKEKEKEKEGKHSKLVCSPSSAVYLQLGNKCITTSKIGQSVYSDIFSKISGAKYGLMIR